MPKLNGQRPSGARRIRKEIDAMSIRQTALFGLAYADALDGVKNRDAVAAAETSSTATRKLSDKDFFARGCGGPDLRRICGQRRI